MEETSSNKVEDSGDWLSTLQYSSENEWSALTPIEVQKLKMPHIPGVEVRKLPPNHLLHGQYGLFATKKFRKFDIVGEYTGQVVGSQRWGEYVASLDNMSSSTRQTSILESYGIDAKAIGNEMRFINSFMSIDFKPNVLLRTVYMGTLPHLVVICIEDIDEDDELLMDYGEDYNNTFLSYKNTQQQDDEND